jgi:hypothetical protein
VPVAAIAQDGQRACNQAAFAVMTAVADRLTDHDLDILGPAWEKTHGFKVTNVRGALCEVTVSETCSVSWEYRPFRGARADPAPVMAMVLELLGARSTEHRGTPPGRYLGLSLKGAVGVALRERGLHARLGQVRRDEPACEVHADVEVANPARPDRGTAWVTDEAAVLWECRFSDPARGLQGLAPADIATAIAQALPRVPELRSCGHDA